jgi:hypothetical protein
MVERFNEDTFTHPPYDLQVWLKDATIKWLTQYESGLW